MATNATQNPVKSAVPRVSNILTILAAAGGIDALEKKTGVTVVAYLPRGTKAGDTMELLINGMGFTKPVKHVITAADLSKHKVMLTIAGNDNAWGTDGTKVLSARLIDSTGNVGEAGGDRIVKHITNSPFVPEGSLTIASAGDSINAADKTAGILMKIDLAGIKATAGSTLELLMNGRAFAVPVIHLLTAKDIAEGKATITIKENAGWGEDGSKSLSARITDASGITSMAGGSTTVTVDTVAPTVSNILGIAAASAGINAAEKAAGVAVVTYLPKDTAAGDTIELLIGGRSFVKPVTHVLTQADVRAHKVTLTISGNDSAWGADGIKIISAWVIDSAGNVGKAGGSRTVRLDTDIPAVQSNALMVTAAENGISAAERTAGVAATVNLASTGAVAGDTVELLINGAAFATPVTHLLNASDISANSVALTISSSAGWGADGSKTLSARIKDTSGNVGANGGNLTFNLDTAAPSALINSLTAIAAANGINSTEKAAGISVVVNLAGANAVEGDTLEILIGGTSFASSVKQVLTAADITASNATINIPGNAGWGTDGSKTLTARITDVAGNIGAAAGSLSVTLDTSAPAAPTSVSVTPVGGNVVANTLNNSNTHLAAQAFIVAGQAAGGSAVLKVGGIAIATDSSIGAGDTTVTFSTSDGNPTNAELQALVAAGGIVTVTLFDAAGNETTSTIGNPMLAVDYGGASAPTGVIVTAAGGSVVANTLNATNTHLTAQATILAGETVGGTALLKVGNIVVAMDTSITASDTTVTFSTSDGSPSAEELQAAVAAGGPVTVTLIDTSGNSSTSTVNNPTLAVDYSIPGTPTNTVVTMAGDISAAEKTAGINVGIDLTGTGAIAGDIVELLIDENAFSSPVTHVLTGAEVVAGYALLTIGGGDAAWGADGNKTLTARVRDAAGNLGTAGGDLTLTLDTVVPWASTNNPTSYSDEDSDFTISEGDIFILAFSEATDETFDIDNLTVSNGHAFGAGATAVWNGNGTELIVTLGSGSDIALGDVISIIGVPDVAGNTANIDFTV